MTEQHSSILALDPTSGPLERKDPRTPARRPRSLNGAVLGVVSNGIGHSDQFMEMLVDELRSAARLSGTVWVSKPSVGLPPSKDDWQRLTSEATVAVTGFGG